jgi:hypothetical protein
VRAEVHQSQVTLAEAPKASASSLDLVSGRAASRNNKQVVQTLLRALQPLSNLRSSRSIPLPFVTAFLTVALDEAKGVNAYAREMGIDRRKMSRYLRDIGGTSRNGGPGLGLVIIKPHPDHPQRTQVFLTEKGRAIGNAVFEQLGRLSNRVSQAPRFGRFPD